MKTQINTHLSILARLIRNLNFSLPLSLACLIFFLTLPVKAQFYYTTDGNSVTIAGYAGSVGIIAIPSTLNVLIVSNGDPIYTNLPVSNIGTNAFANNSILTNVTLPNTVANISLDAFSGCTNLTSITIQSSTTNIGEGAFGGCTALTSITVPNNVSSIGIQVFANCTSLTNVIIPNTVSTIGIDSFENCYSLASIILPDSVNNIGFGAFAYCTNLSSFTIPNSVTNIGGMTFEFCTKLMNVTIPGGIKNINGAFYNCTSLKTATILNGVTSIGSYYISPYVVGAGAFTYCTNLTTVIIPSSVTNIGDDAFSGCISVTNVAIPNSVTSIGSYAFEDCIHLATISLSKNVSNIEDNTFSFCGLTSITIPDSVTNIEYGAFQYCENLTSAVVGNGVIGLGEETFLGCTSLTNICFEGNAPFNLDYSTFEDDPVPVVYYVIGTSGWGEYFAALPTAPCMQCAAAATSETSSQPNKDIGCFLCQFQASAADPGDGDPIRIGNGNLYEEVVDFATAGANRLGFTRYYNSLGDTNTLAVSLGSHWRSIYDRYLRIGSSITVERPDAQELIFTSNGTGGWASDSDVDFQLLQLGSTWTLIDGDDNIETYNAAGLLTSIQDRDGYTQSLQYNGNNQLATVTDSFGRTLQFTYQGNLLKTVIAPNGLILTYGYNSSGVNPGVLDRLASVTYSTSPQTGQSYLYENAAVPFALTGIIDEDGNRYGTWTYDATGRATSSQHAGGADLTSVYYNDTDGSRTVTNALGSVIVYKFTTLQGVPKVTEIDRLATASVPAAIMYQTYDTNGYLATVTDWNTNLTGTANDSRGLPLVVNEAIGTAQTRTTTSTYLANSHLPTQVIAPRKTTNFAYDTNGNLLALTETDNSSILVPYSTSGQTRTWTNTFDNFGHVLTATGPRTDVIATTRFTYDASNNVSTITDPLGHVTRMTNYTGSGLAQTMIDANNVTNQFTYDIRDRLLTRTVLAASGNATNSFAYDAVGNLVAITQPNGSQLFYQYDAAHRLTSVTNVLGESIHYTLNAAGNIIQQTTTNASGALAKTQSRVFDQLSRVLQEIGASGQTTTYSYDANGNPISITDGLTNTTAKAFDALNRLIYVLDPLKNLTSFNYDAQDNCTNVTDPRTLTTTYVYDGFGRVIQETSPDKGTTVYTLDKAGNRISEVDARGVVTQRTFDKLNRVISESYPASPSENIIYGYDDTKGGNFGVGRLTEYADETGGTTLIYNERGDVISTTRAIDGTGYTTACGYDLADHVTSIVYPSGHVISYGRDVLGRINSATYSPSTGGSVITLASGVTYAPFGPLTGLQYGNGLTRSNRFDLDYRMTNLIASGSSTHVQNLAYAYNAVNNITTIADNLAAGNSQVFSYDSDYRLTKATGYYGYDDYGYDADGNRLSRQTAGTTENYSYAANANRLQSTIKSGITRSFSYTTNGNVGSDNRGGSTNFLFGYGNRNRYKTLTAGSSTIATYAYNALGERLVKTTGGATTIYHYDQAGHLIAESQSNGTLIREYVWLDDMPLAQIESNGALYYIHPDYLKRPERITDVNQNIVWDNETQPFGEAVVNFQLPSGKYNTYRQFQINIGGQATYSYIVQATTNLAKGNWFSLATNAGPFTFADASTPTPQTRFYRVLYTPTSAAVGTITQNLRFPGQYYDAESGLNYNMMRDYDPTLGRYIQSDPIGLGGGINLYESVMNSPINGIDPLGLLTILIHGTWSNPSRAFNAEFVSAVTTTYGESPIFYKWSGGDNDEARQAAARSLARFLEDYEAEHPCERINVVAHSHGGNVAFLASQYTGARIDNLVTLGTPIESYSPNMENIGHILMVSSSNDRIQPIGGSLLSFFGYGQIGPAASSFAPTDRITNMRLTGVGHLDLPTASVWQMIQSSPMP